MNACEVLCPRCHKRADFRFAVIARVMWYECADCGLRSPMTEDAPQEKCIELAREKEWREK